MELGGNAPFIVLKDADVEAAVAGAMVAKMRNMGEACTAANRFYVHEDIHDEFIARLARAMGALKVGNGLEADVAVGPLVNADTRDKVEALVEDARSRGAKVVTGGAAFRRRLFLRADGALARAGRGALLARRDLWPGGAGAVVPRRGAAGGACQCHRVRTGGLRIHARPGARSCPQRAARGRHGGLNRGIVSDPAAPFGGVKQSGLGREGAHEGMMEFLETQYVSVSW